MRVDVAVVRAIEEAVAGDFDALAGAVLAGGEPRVVAGFSLVSTGVNRAIDLSLRTAAGILLHPTASETGTVFRAPADRADEVLSPTNTRVSGAFAPSSVNFIGIDLTRQPDDGTRDLVAFRDDTTGDEEERTIPTGRTLDYRIVISTLDFASTPGLAAVAKVTTDAANNVTAIADARAFLFRLIAPYEWPLGRGTSSDFTPAGDKAIESLADSLRAIETRLWELGGGERWYAPTTERDVIVTGAGAVFSNGQYFEWDGTHLHWKNLSLLFGNSTATYNDVAAQATDSAGLTDLADGECIYVDVDRSANRTGGTALVGVKSLLTSLGAPGTPGARYVIAWRHGIYIFTRDQTGPVGQANTPPATTTLNGAVRLSATPPVSGAPVVPTITATDQAIAGGLTRHGAATIASGAMNIANQAEDTSVAIGHGALGDVSLTAAATSLLKLLGMRGIYLSVTGQTSAPPADTGILEYRTNGLASPNKRYQLGVRWPDGSFGLIIQSEAV